MVGDLRATEDGRPYEVERCWYPVMLTCLVVCGLLGAVALTLLDVMW
ncbi:MAG: hypothetical protein FWD21_03810 [Peptococcaceae bacterium]|nr:hypothetical protein [Peptococcaceae bacterium]